MSNGGLPFFKYFDETDTIIYPADATYKTLFPTGCPLSDDTKEQIKVHFCNYLTNFSRPQYWLSRFHNLLNREADKWVKLLATEDVLSPEDAKYNYDMTETTHFDSSGNSSLNTSNTNTSESNSTAYVSDTPESSVSDIETYMSSADKSSQTGSGSSTGSSTGNDSATGDQLLTRKGNIGVMTFDQILSGYREATKWCAYDEVIFPELEKLFIGIWEEGNEYGYLWWQN